MRIAWLLLLAGCLHSNAVTCPDQSLCPEGTECRQLTDPAQNICADPGQIAACVGLHDHAHCGTDGRCYGGVCLVVACGNGRVDRPDPMMPGDVGEVCDDGNQTSGDGCSANCASDETCGNGIVDSVKGEVCDDGNHVQHDGCDSVCQPESPHWTQLSLAAPSPRVQAAMAYDSSRGRAVMFGGIDIASGADLGDTWEWDGATWASLSPTNAPSPRHDHAMAYDAKRRRVVLFGGGAANNGGSDTWEWDGTNWTAAAVFVAPQPRTGHRMVYDSGREHVVLFGGFATGPSPVRDLNDTWEWDGAWTDISDDAPPPVGTDMALAYDPSRGRTVLFEAGAIWELDDMMHKWTSITTTGPTPPSRTFSAMAYDPVKKVVVMFAGDSFGTPVDDTWAWDGTAWHAIAATAPPTRQGQAMATDIDHRQIVMFGGAPDPLTWLWTGTAWQSIATSPPAAQAGLQSARDAQTALTTTFGDEIQGFGTPLTWRFDTGFTLLTLALQPDPTASVLVQDDAHDLGVLFDTKSALTWTWNGTAWKQLAPATSPPKGDWAFAYDGATKQAILFGSNPDPATWAWDGTTWKQLAPAHQPSARIRVALAYDPIHRDLVLFGGADPNIAPIGGTWLWDGSDWTAPPLAVEPLPRSHAGLAWNASRQRLTMFGGEGEQVPLGDLWEWDGTAWQQIATSNGPTPRFQPAMLSTNTGDGLLVFGGFLTSGSMARTSDDLWLLRWEANDIDEACRESIDGDGDGLVGCADLDCWATCTPTCPPGSTCDPNAPHCGDGVCNVALENCHNCPGDCACVPVCGDFFCDAPESIATCPGDCR